MKKFLSIILAALMVASFAACEKNETPNDESNTEAHEHSYNTEWSKDNTHHWYTCKGEDCKEISSKAEHTWDDGKITTPATAQADGVKTYNCTACGQTKTETVKFIIKTTVTEAEWKAALELNNATATGFLTENGEKEDVLFKLDKTVYFSEMDGYSAWVIEKDGKFYMTDGKGTEDEIPNFAINIGSVLMSFHLPEYSKFTYNESSKAYSCINGEDYPDTFNKYNLYFEDGKLLKFEAIDKASNITYCFNFKDYGTTTVEPYNASKPSGTTIQVNKAEWDSMAAISNFDNVTFTTNATFLSGYSDVVPHRTVYKLDGEKASADGQAMTGDSVEALKTMHLKTTIAIVENFEKFAYDETKKCYASIEDIVYNVTILGYDATITVKNAYVELDTDKNLAKIKCEMTQDFVEEGTPKKYVIDAEFTFENYGTTVVE